MHSKTTFVFLPPLAYASLNLFIGLKVVRCLLALCICSVFVHILRLLLCFLSRARIGIGPRTDERDTIGGTAPRSEGLPAMVPGMRGRE